MRTTTLLALAAGVVEVSSLNLSKRSDGNARVVQHDIERRHVPSPHKRDQARRSRRASTKTVQESLSNEETLYFASCTLGTPSQTLKLHIDTGSSDLWVNTPDSTTCSASEGVCKYAGTYSANSSSSYAYVNSLFNISYVDGSGAAGDYATDTFTIGGATIDNQQFGIGYTSSSAEGILGIGYASNEAILSASGGTEYANVPIQMVQTGLINSNAYSLWLNDLDASTGSILFGGVNTEKYTGSLESVPIVKEYGLYSEFIIALTAIGTNGNQGSIASNLDSGALLDSGSSLMYLPNDVCNTLYKELGASYDSSEGAAFIDCSMADNDTTIDFTFSSPTISVAMSELVIEAGTQNGKTYCILGIAPADGSTPVLGDTFIRSAYIVYDLNNNEISLAQTNFNSTTNNILEITNGTSGVPSATLVASAVTSVSQATGGAIDGGLGTITSDGAGAPATPMPHSAAKFGAIAAAAGLAFAL